MGRTFLSNKYCEDVTGYTSAKKEADGSDGGEYIPCVLRACFEFLTAIALRLIIFKAIRFS